MCYGEHAASPVIVYELELTGTVWFEGKPAGVLMAN